MTATPVVTFNAQSNLGYAADQVPERMTLADLMAEVEYAIEQFGEDAEVVLYQTNNEYGANYGALDASNGLFTAADED